MPVDHQNRIAFCHVPRTAGVSICRALRLKVIEKHEPASWYRKHFPDYHLFAVDRPYKDRIRSALGWSVPDRRRQEGFTGTFEELVEQIAAAENNGLMLKPNGYFLDCSVDTLIPFDNLEAGLNDMLLVLGLSPVRLPKTNSFRRGE
jgi:hypothetical protein